VRVCKQCGKELRQRDESAVPTVRKRKPRSLERRLHLYDFVNGCGVRAWGRVPRGSWERVAEAWNREHPHDAMSPDNLARQWGYAKSDPDVLFNLEVREILVRLQRAKPCAQS
jgi:hypothetical protein